MAPARREVSKRDLARLRRREAALAPEYRERPAEALTRRERAEEARRIARDELKVVRRWRKAYLGGDKDSLKRDAGAVMGSLYAKVRQMLERVEADGLMVPTAKMISGERGGKKIVYELVPHPLLKPIAELLKILHLDPVEFGVTPGTSDAGAQPRGAIRIGRIDVKVLQVQQEEREQRFLEAMKKAEALRQADPVYKMIAGQGEEGVD